MEVDGDEEDTFVIMTEEQQSVLDLVNEQVSYINE